ncbi:hypothetical protein [Thermogemmatispora tikiterensis]|uniref:Uncharacterized protein n=1 Tax=Thermogemmatispora tikiterensis TaxID=1825093 RepID=A0A328VJJ0_9CHLR|nr:hypothetical protein [Thermogemmatispora tikiterensis]RAQ95940.1 hypothetical protein A4R35_10375 [Thermogemmatispora tikiterensis]
MSEQLPRQHHRRDQVPPGIVEHTALPRIGVEPSRKRRPSAVGELEYTAFVHGYVAGEPFWDEQQGREVSPLFLLSLVGAPGDSALLRGIFSALVHMPPGPVTIKGIGSVILAHQVAPLKDQGPWHWTYSQVGLGDLGLHALVECPALTLLEPRSAQQPASNLGVSDKAISPAISCRPFLLLVPPDQQAEVAYLHRLDRRVPWPLHERWAAWLWQAAQRRQWVTPLTVRWFFPQASGEAEAAFADQLPAEPPPQPIFTSAWLCQAEAAGVLADIQEGLHAGVLDRLTDI